MSINGFGNNWLQTDHGQNVYINENNTPGPSNQEFLLPPSQPPVSMTSQPQPHVPFGWNSMAQAHSTPIEHQNLGFPSQPESNANWNSYGYHQYNNGHQNLMTSQYQNPEFVNQRVNNYPVHPPHFTNPNIPTSSMTSYSTWGQSGSDSTIATAPKDNHWPMNKENQMVYDVIDRPGHEYLENEREMTSQYQQPNDEFQRDPNPSKSQKSNNPNDPLDAEIPENVIIDTVEFREKVLRELETLGITPGLFSKNVLGKFSQCAYYMLGKNKNWDKMRGEGHNTFRRMYNWMEMSREKKMAYFSIDFKKPLVESEDSNDPLDAKIPDGIVIDTAETYKRVAHEIETYRIPKGLFAEKILRITSAHLSTLIRRMEPWNEMSTKVQRNFSRMYNWMEMPLDTRLAFFGTQLDSAPKLLTDAQKEHLKAAFQKSPYPSRQEKRQMAEQLQLTFARVDNFFMSRRYKLKRLTKNKNKNERNEEFDTAQNPIRNSDFN